jgi:hypothetical protein
MLVIRWRQTQFSNDFLEGRRTVVTAVCRSGLPQSGFPRFLATGEFSLSAYASQFLKCPSEPKRQLALHRGHFTLGMSLDDFDLGKISRHWSRLRRFSGMAVAVYIYGLRRGRPSS